MSQLLIRPEKYTNRIEDFGYEYLSFETRKLAKGQKYESETGAKELCLVVLGGVCSVKTATETWNQIGGRTSVPVATSPSSSRSGCASASHSSSRLESTPRTSSPSQEVMSVSSSVRADVGTVRRSAR